VIYWPAKKPEEVEDFYFDFTNAFEITETIDTKTIAADANDITVDSEAIIDSKVQVWLSGGTEGTVVKVNCIITTSLDRTYAEVAVLEINGEAVSLADVKMAQKIDVDDEDTILAAFLRAAIGHIESYSGKLLTQKIVTQRVNAFPSDNAPIRLWAGPAQEILEVTYDDAAGDNQTLTDTDFRLIGGNDNLLLPLSGADWPTCSSGHGNISITYVAGYGPTDRERVQLVQAVILLFGHWNTNREAVALASRSTNIELPLGVVALVKPFRNLGLA
jgi:uncharacterized phiE125 gp8 family phage protein